MQRAGETPLSKPKKAAFAVLTVLLTFGAIELISFLYLSFLHDGWAGLGQIRELQARSIGLEDADPAWRRELPAHLGEWHTHFVIHPYLGYVVDLDPNTLANRLRRGGPEGIHYGLTLFEPGIFHAPSEERPVIAVTGGSMAVHLVRDARDTLRQEIARRIPRFSQAVVVNLALGGYKQPQQLISLNYFLALGAHFDVVINLDGFNEIALPPSENLPKGVFPFFPRGWYFRVQESSDPSQRLAEGRLAYLLEARRQFARELSSSPYRYSFSAALLWSLRDRHLETRIAEQRQSLVESAGRTDAGYRVTGPPWPEQESADPGYQSLAAFWMRCSELMHHVAEGAGAHYFHVLQPNQYVAGSKPMAEAERRIATEPAHLGGIHAAKGYSYLREHGRRLRSRGVQFSDQSSVFSRVSEALYVDNCCHVNERGSKILAEEIAGLVVSQLLAGSEPTDELRSSGAQP